MYWNWLTLRHIIQIVSALISNIHLRGFINGKIYDGELKHLCVPFLNCYSCPGAVFSCPLGAAQTVLNFGTTYDLPSNYEQLNIIQKVFHKTLSIASAIPVFVIGFMTLIGVILGRVPCGLLCPFGFFQDLVNKIPSRKITNVPSFLNYGKYIALLLFVILLPTFYTNQIGISEPIFCKLICPAGTLQGGLLLPLLDPDLRSVLGKLFLWKIALLIIISCLAIFIKRPFCNWVCPIGAYLGLFNRISFLRLTIQKEICIKCEICSRQCAVGIDPTTDLDSPNCVRCGLCVSSCAKKALRIGVSKYE